MLGGGGLQLETFPDIVVGNQQASFVVRPPPEDMSKRIPERGLQ